jgi:hypothetical protein
MIPPSAVGLQADDTAGSWRLARRTATASWPPCRSIWHCPPSRAPICLVAGSEGRRLADLHASRGGLLRALALPPVQSSAARVSHRQWAAGKHRGVASGRFRCPLLGKLDDCRLRLVLVAARRALTGTSGDLRALAAPAEHDVREPETAQQQGVPEVGGVGLEPTTSCV